MVRTRETAPGTAVIGRMKFPAFAAKKNSTCLVAYVNLVSKLASVLFYPSNLCILEITYII